MDYEQVLDRVIGFLAELPRSQGKTITGSTPLSEDVFVDSLTMLQVILFLETEFGLTLDRSDLDHIDTPASVAELIVGKNSGQS